LPQIVIASDSAAIANLSEPRFWGLRDYHDYKKTKIKSFNPINQCNPGSDKLAIASSFLLAMTNFNLKTPLFAAGEERGDKRSDVGVSNLYAMQLK
jgi:hypothetical protein